MLFGTFDVSLELLIRVTHVIPRTVLITENVVECHKHVHSQPSPLLAQARRKRYREQQQQASAGKQAGFLNLMNSAAAENKPALHRIIDLTSGTTNTWIPER